MAHSKLYEFPPRQLRENFSADSSNRHRNIKYHLFSRTSFFLTQLLIFPLEYFVRLWRPLFGRPPNTLFIILFLYIYIYICIYNKSGRGLKREQTNSEVGVKWEDLLNFPRSESLVRDCRNFSSFSSRRFSSSNSQYSRILCLFIIQ